MKLSKNDHAKFPEPKAWKACWSMLVETKTQPSSWMQTLYRHS